MPYTAFYVDEFRNNCCYEKVAVRDSEQYTPEQMEILLSGGEVPCDWDSNGNPIAWESIHQEDNE